MSFNMSHLLNHRGIPANLYVSPYARAANSTERRLIFRRASCNNVNYMNYEGLVRTDNRKELKIYIKAGQLSAACTASAAAETAARGSRSRKT
jgi:hypothetical protein